MFERLRHRGHRRDEGHGHAQGEHRDRRFARGGFGIGGHEGRGRHRWGGGRIGRLFEQGDLRFIILSLIDEKPRHGYEIIKAIEDKLQGLYSPSPGVIYPTLTLLEEMGFATVAPGDGSKKLYAITDEGKAHLAGNRSVLAVVAEKIAEATRRFGGGTPTQILRATENLKLALQMRLSKGTVCETESLAIAAILDRAASEIERV